jgi:hypothetical protein
MTATITWPGSTSISTAWPTSPGPRAATPAPAAGRTTTASTCSGRRRTTPSLRSRSDRGSTIDFDRDGDEDLLVGLGGTVGIKVYRNDVGTLNNWINIRLEGVGGSGYANKAAIGAKVAVTAGGVTQTRTVYAGDGHQGPQKPLSLAFGLGTATIIDSIQVRWPNDTLTTSEMFDVAVNQFLTIQEPCDYATDPTNLVVDKDVDDIRLTWDDPAATGWTWNIYRDTGPDPSQWGEAHETGVTDGDLGTPGIQWTDIDGMSGSSYYYLVTAVNQCGETPLR